MYTKHVCPFATFTKGLAVLQADGQMQHACSYMLIVFASIGNANDSNKIKIRYFIAYINAYLIINILTRGPALMICTVWSSLLLLQLTIIIILIIYLLLLFHLLYHYLFMPHITKLQ